MDKKDYSSYYGNKIGKWTILGEGSKRAYVKCECSCGKQKEVWIHSILNGMSTSCGCSRKKEIPRERKILKHRWRGIKDRCYHTYSSCYYKYGAKGIKMCDEWKNDFEAFYSWSIANGFREELTIDRIDCKGDYTTENCRWADVYTQANNKTTVKKYLYKGEMLTIPQISKICGIDASAIYHRLNQRKWSIEKATETPVEVGRNQFTEINDEKIFEYKGEKISKNELIKKSNLDAKTVRKRLLNGWSIDDIIEIPFGKHKEKWRREHNV